MIKKDLDEWVSKNYEDLTQISKNIIGLKNFDASVLVNMTYEYLYEKIDILNVKNIRSVAINWMNTNIKRKNTRIKSGKHSECIRLNHIEIDFDLSDCNITNKEKELMLESILLYKETIVGPLMLSVYILYIEKGFNSSSKLAKQLGINRTYCSKWIKELKNDINIFHYIRLENILYYGL